VLAAHQPVGGGFGTGGLDKQVIDVGLTVGHIGQAGVGELLGQLVDLPVAVRGVSTKVSSSTGGSP
jgi:hypothetical protein